MGAFSQRLRHRFSGGPVPKPNKPNGYVDTFWRGETHVLPSPYEPPATKPDKGLKGGSCNVTACQRPNSAFWYNKGTQRYYCVDCAREINWPGGRALSLELYGTPYLCELESV